MPDPVIARGSIEPRLMVDGVFEGGGALGVAYVGALRALEARGVWFSRVVGNSAGAVTAAMIAAGFNATEMEYLSAPAGVRPRPASLPAGLERTDGASLQDLPASASEFSRSDRRHNLVWRVVSGQVIDRLLDVRIPLPDPSPIANGIVNAIPASIDPPDIKYHVSGRTYSVAPPGGAPSFSWTSPGFDVDVPTPAVPLTSVQGAARAAANAAIAAAPREVRLGDLAFLTAPDARQMFADAVVDALLDGHRFPRALFNLLAEGGIYKGDVALDGLRRTLRAKLGLDVVRFRDLSMQLAICATNMSKQKLEVYSSTATPDMEVAEAVRRSMSVPFYFRPRIQGGDDIVDGGVLENFPAWMVLIADNALFQNKPEDLARTKLLFQLDSNADRPAGSPCAGHPPSATGDAVTQLAEQWGGDLIERRFLGRVYDCVQSQMASSAIGEKIARAYPAGTTVVHISIPLYAYDWLEFDQDAPVWRGMCCRGWETTMSTLLQRDLRGRFLTTSPTTNPYGG